MLKNDVPHAASGKSQSRPLELLQVLIAFGGRDVAVEKIAGAVCPGIDSDYAHKSFTTTLHRLRKTLGEDRALVLKDGRLGLDGRFVRSDSSALEQACIEVDRCVRSEADGDAFDGRTARPLARRVIDLYQGPFLGDRSEQSWALGTRARLRTRFLRAVGALGQHFEAIGQWRRAADLYSRPATT